MALHMTVKSEIKNHQLVIDLPEGLADGEVVVTLDITPLPLPSTGNRERDDIRLRLLESGLLQTNLGLPEDFIPEDITDEELEELGRLPEGAPSSGN